MSATVAAALRKALNEARPTLAPKPKGPTLAPKPKAPTTVADASKYFGGTWEPPKSPWRGKSASVALAGRYNRSRGQGWRWATGATQPKAPTRAKILRTARERQQRAWAADNEQRLASFDPARQVRRNGVRMRVRMWFVISDPPCQIRTMPGTGPAQIIDGAECAPTMDAWTSGEHDAAGALLLKAFLEAYDFDALPCEDEADPVDSCEISIR